MSSQRWRPEACTFGGVDPGVAETGYGFIVKSGGTLRLLDFGVIRTPSSLPLHKRLLTIYAELERLFLKYEPTVICIEKVYFSKNAKTAFSVGQARGIVLLLAAAMGIEILEVSPTALKESLVGYGRADKRQVQFMVAKILGLEEPPKPDDAADALAMAIYASERKVKV